MVVVVREMQQIRATENRKKPQEERHLPAATYPCRKDAKTAVIVIRPSSFWLGDISARLNSILSILLFGICLHAVPPSNPVSGQHMPKP